MNSITVIRVVAGILAAIVFTTLAFRTAKKNPR
jgi:hypothetical protein